MKLSTKLLGSKVLVALVPSVLIPVIVLWQVNQGFDRATAQCKEGFEAGSTNAQEALIAGAKADLSHMAQNVYSMCEVQQKLLQKKVNYDLNVAREVLQQAGPVTISSEKVEWDCINQFSKAKTPVKLGKMMVGKTWLGQNRAMDKPSPVVDHVQNLVGGTCTIFQRMNEAGDLLRVCTNVLKLDKTRAIGTYIPAREPDGKANTVVETVLKGETFRGRAFVVNAWYITAYEPIKDESGKVVGVLYVGVKEESSTALRQAIMDIQVGQTGYVFVLNAKGHTKGHYVISKGGQRDGEDIWQAKDADGRLFIQDMCKLAQTLGPNQIGEITYPWKNAGEDNARLKLAKIAYFEPWDWVIGVGAYEDEFYQAVAKNRAENEQRLASIVRTQSTANRTIVAWSIIAAIVLMVLTVVFALAATRGIVRPLNRVIDHLTDGAEQIEESSGQVASTSQQLAEGASEQASSLEETSSALEEMAAMSRTNADNAQQANEFMSETSRVVHEADEAMKETSKSMQEISEASDQIRKIIKVIEEIAFQTNLLALNAAVEAARAGEHGKGFAVVADEVRNLAQRAAEAARETGGLIEQTVHRVQRGVELNQSTTESFTKIGESTGKIADLIGQIAQASSEQAQGVEQVNSAVSQMDRVTQSNAAGAEESASASEELSAQAKGVRQMVNELVALVGNRIETASAESTATKSTSPPAATTAVQPAAPRQGHQSLAELDFDSPSDDF